MTHTPEPEERFPLVFTLPDTIDHFGLKHTQRRVRCECIRGKTAQEIKTLWEQYRTGCAGLNPAAYRACVEALKLWVRAYDEADDSLKGNAWIATRHALAHAQEHP